MTDESGEASNIEEPRPSGVPGPYGLGESKKQALALVVALGGLVLLAAAYWYEAAK